MNFITAFVLDQNFLFGSDILGHLYVWNVARIFKEHLNREVEVSKNTYVYSYSAKWKITTQEISFLKVFNKKLYIISSNSLYKIPLETFVQYVQDENTKIQATIDLVEYASQFNSSKLDAYHSQEFHISSALVGDDELLYIGSKCGRIFVINAEDDIIQVIDVVDAVKDIVLSMVPIQKNPITSLLKINKNELLIGSELGLLMILNLNESRFSSYLKYPGNLRLSPVIKTVFNPLEQTMVSLHEDYIAVWNLTVQTLIKAHEYKSAVDIVMDGQNLIIGDDSGSLKINDIQQDLSKARTIETSQGLVLGIEKQNQIVFVRGNTPFIDVYKGSYMFTLSSI